MKASYFLFFLSMLHLNTIVFWIAFEIEQTIIQPINNPVQATEKIVFCRLPSQVLSNALFLFIRVDLSP